MKPAEPVQANEKTPFEKMTDLTRRIVAVDKDELHKPKPKRMRKRTD